MFITTLLVGRCIKKNEKRLEINKEILHLNDPVIDSFYIPRTMCNGLMGDLSNVVRCEGYCHILS